MLCPPLPLLSLRRAGKTRSESCLDSMMADRFNERTLILRLPHVAASAVRAACRGRAGVGAPAPMTLTQQQQPPPPPPSIDLRCGSPC